MRLTCFAFLLLSALLVWAQTGEKPKPEGRVTGTVLDRRGQPLQHVSVRVFREETHMYMPTAESDEAGQFVVDELEPGTYDVFGEGAGYPDKTLSFYGKEEPTRVVLGNGGTATVVLVLGPVAGVLTGTIIDRTTGKAIVPRHASRFIVKKVSDPEDSIEFSGPAKFRWLIPPATEVTLEVSAEGYKPWSDRDPSNPSKLLPLRLESGEEKTLTIELEPEVQHASR
jgi:hypothetical protein